MKPKVDSSRTRSNAWVKAGLVVSMHENTLLLPEKSVIDFFPPSFQGISPQLSSKITMAQCPVLPKINRLCLYSAKRARVELRSLNANHTSVQCKLLRACISCTCHLFHHGHLFSLQTQLGLLGTNPQD